MYEMKIQNIKKKVATEIGSTALDGVISIGVEWGKSAFGDKIYEYLR